MALGSEFKEFMKRGNVLDLAVAVVIGGAFGKIVTALVEGLVMPLVGLAVPGGDWRAMVMGPFKVGSVMGAVVDFFCIALVIFLVFVKGFARLQQEKPVEPAAAPTTKDCPMCLEPVPVAARRCRHCTSELG
jgi:large conductance mechanosensitive channel